MAKARSLAGSFASSAADGSHIDTTTKSSTKATLGSAKGTSKGSKAAMIGESDALLAKTVGSKRSAEDVMEYFTADVDAAMLKEARIQITEGSTLTVLRLEMFATL